MLRTEFDSYAGTLAEGITDEHYEVIHRVYQYHPMISDINGKSQLIELLKMGGMALMNELDVVASECETLEIEINEFDYRARQNKEEAATRRQQLENKKSCYPRVWKPRK